MLTITCKKILSKRFRPLCQRELDDFITLMVGLYQECRRGRCAVHCTAQYRDIMMIIKLMGYVVAGTMPVDTFRVHAFPCVVFRLRFSGLQKSILGLYGVCRNWLLRHTLLFFSRGSDNLSSSGFLRIFPKKAFRSQEKTGYMQKQSKKRRIPPVFCLFRHY